MQLIINELLPNKDDEADVLNYMRFEDHLPIRRATMNSYLIAPPTARGLSPTR